ncbi:MAG: hypothetical protein E7270_01240 [Lachnospiraceae bacterium]|nr:hypothetical protein [Lachnospiraceae bacterium]
MKYLLNVVETWRVDTEDEALEMRDEMAQSSKYELQSFQYTVKFNKKTEEEYVVVKAKKIINLEKEPNSGVKVSYDY